MNPNPTVEQQMVAAVGHHGLWGYSSTFDLLEALESSELLQKGELDEPIRILLVHPGDIRHIITTMSRRRRHSASNAERGEIMRPIHFYLLESNAELIGRELLLMEILFDFEVPIRQRAGVFLEVFGNALVQERTSRYIERLGYEMRDLIQDGTGRLEDVVDLSCLKYRERDNLERCWKSYSRNVPFDMRKLRDHRLRGWHGDRYDHRKQLADMDYHSGLRETASIIHIKQFKEWRVSGIAYELGDHVYTEPNRTMMTFTEGMMKKGKDSGLKKDVKGYWGDIVSSPYFSFGVDVDSRICESEDSAASVDSVVSSNAGTGAAQLHKHVEGLFEIMNKNTGTEQHRHHTVEVAMYNLFSILWEVETGKGYKMSKAHDIYSGLGAEAGFSEDLEKEKEKEAKEKEIKQELGMIEEEEEQVPEQDMPPPPPPTSSEIGQKEQEQSPQPVKNEDDMVQTEGDIDELAKQIKRAECIVESVSGVKVFPMVGTPASVLYKHINLKDSPHDNVKGTGKYFQFFDAAFVSARAAGCLNQSDFYHLLKRSTNPTNSSSTSDTRNNGALLAIESAKFMVALGKAQKSEFNDKILEMVIGTGALERAMAQGSHGSGMYGKHVPSTAGGVIPRRRRDENDKADDVFFSKPEVCGVL